MQIGFDIPLSPEDEALLVSALGCTPATLEATVANHAKAALLEHLECYLGRRVFSRGSDLLEYRLSLLVRHAFGGRIPTAAQVSDLFQTTMSTSRTLIRNTFSKYRYELSEAESLSARDVLEHVTWADAAGCYAQITAPNLLEVLNRRLLSDNPTLREVSRVPGVVGTYLIDRDAYEALCRLFNAAPVPQPAHP
jgi:hypothetical protein